MNASTVKNPRFSEGSKSGSASGTTGTYSKRSKSFWKKTGWECPAFECYKVEEYPFNEEGDVLVVGYMDDQSSER